MSADLSGYTFTNGTKVTYWIASLPADDRDRAAKVVEEFVARRKPLNMLQVKITLASPPTESNPDLDEDDEVQRPESDTATAPFRSNTARGRTSSQLTPPLADDAYNSPGPIKPSVDPVPPVKPAEGGRKWTLSKMFLSVACVILAIAVFTNPSRQTHVRVLTESVAHATARSMGQDVGTDMFGEMFGFGQPRFTDDAIESLVYDVLNSQLEYHNYILFSTCSAPVGYEEQTVTVGAFGMVRATEDNLTVN